MTTISRVRKKYSKNTCPWTYRCFFHLQRQLEHNNTTYRYNIYVTTRKGKANVRTSLGQW